MGVDDSSYDSENRIITVQGKEYRLPDIINLIECDYETSYKQLSSAQYPII